ncbi:hypothetical protein [Seonamhaeicola aphaedonensis]|uniref:Uncharacterized protein n=1 Tax=Seonamhaeicola aphaedonensis TaxID=1461338 RepID=A0A3D9H868_9FLAO|nr:hypothetical protein [Seonamhaeicola aphaedonensis]RED45679.1 hypothetical protein DFQ02_10857 [Seonamhaeicola aphaedonensis]
MKKHIFILLTAIILISCALESEFSLPKGERIDTELLGLWYPENHQESRDWIKIEAFDEFTYKFTLNDDEGTCYSFSLGNFKIMNVVDTTNEKPNSFYGYVLSENQLKVMEVNEKLVDEDFNSQKELIEFFKTNVDRPEFFVYPEIFKRKKEE